MRERFRCIHLSASGGLTVDEERRRIIEYYGDASFETLSIMLDRQFQMLKTRSFRIGTFLALISILFYELSVIVVIYSKRDMAVR